MSFSAKFDLAVEWFDSRLIWNNLNDDKFLNIPSKDVTNKLWVPVIIFENTETQYETPLDKKSRIIAEKKGNYTLSTMHEMEEIAYYSGSENNLKYSRNFYLRFKCQFELKNYPFDSQLCTFKIKKPSKEDKFVTFHPNLIVYSGPRGLAEFYITKVDMIAEAEWEEHDIEVRIFMKRRVAKHILSTYLPSICIQVIAQV